MTFRISKTTKSTGGPSHKIIVIRIGIALLVGCVGSIANFPIMWKVEAASISACEGTIFHAARLIIGDGEVIENGALLVKGTQIIEVGVADELATTAGTCFIDLSGKTVMPAMIDAHAHLGYEGYTSWGSDNYTRKNLIDHLHRYAYYGFSAVFSAGSDAEDLAQQIQKAQQAGELGGARFLFSAGMAPPGQGPNPLFLDHAIAVARNTGMTVLRGIASEQQARTSVQEVANKAIPFIKIWVDDRGGSQQKMHPDIYRAIIAEARARGIKVFVHQQNAQDMPALLDAGVAGFLHGRISPALDDALATRISNAGAFVIPNLGLGELRRAPVGDDPFLQEIILPEVISRLRKTYAEQSLARQEAEATIGRRSATALRERHLREGFARLLVAGVDIILGTDAGALPDHFFGYTGHRELEIFVRLGMSPMQAIIAATSSPARRLGLSQSGSLTAGKSADFIILDANPLDDIRHTRDIWKVYLRGQEVDREGLRIQWTGQRNRLP